MADETPVVPQGETPTPETPPSKADEALSALLSKHDNDASKVALMLLSENRDLREKNRDLRGKVTPAGAVVLAGDDATAWSELRALGKPADLKAALAERDTLKAETAAARRAETIRTAAEVVKFKPTVLSTLVQDLAITISDPDARGARTVTVKDGDKDVPLPQYAEQKWKDFLPSLKADVRPVGTPSTRPGSTAPPAPTAPERPRRPLGMI